LVLQTTGEEGEEKVVELRGIKMEISAMPGGPARLYALHLHLRPVQNGTLMPFSGELVHGAFLRWLQAAAPDIAAWLHEGNKRRLFTCSSLGFPRVAGRKLEIERRNIHLPLDPHETYLVRLTLLLGDLFPLFHEALTKFDISHLGTDTPPFLQLGKQLFLLEEVITTNDDSHGWTGFTSLSSLVEQARQVKCKREEILTLDFVSLTAFSRAEGKAGYGSHAFMLPLPQFVFQNLARRWQDIAPPELAGIVQMERLEHYLQEDGVIIVDYDLKAHHVHFTTHQQRGFLGSCTYQLRGHDESTSEDAPLTLRQQIHLLARLAFYTGVGYKTTMGLGQARLRT
jgi:CRISPR-associated endoribonuclease Cas6